MQKIRRETEFHRLALSNTSFCQERNYRKRQFDEAYPNWIGGGATRPITQAWIDYTIVVGPWVNNLDDPRTGIVERNFASYLAKSWTANSRALDPHLTGHCITQQTKEL